MDDDEKLLEMRLEAESEVQRAIDHADTRVKSRSSEAWLAEVTQYLEAHLTGRNLKYACELLEDDYIRYGW